MVESVHAWHPPVPRVQEVLHATFEQHAYPAHTHDSWTVLLIDEGAVAYDLERRAHHAVPNSVTILPPFVPHDGRSAVAGKAFRKRVLYLDSQWLTGKESDAAIAHPLLRSPDAFAAVTRIHAALTSPAEVMEAESGVLDLHDILHTHLSGARPPTKDSPLAQRLRELLDARLTETFTVADAASLLGTHPGHLQRAFSQAYGIPPHQYVTGRRVDLARRLLLDGRSPAQAAFETGFHDQPHLTRHFRRMLGTTPAAFRARAA